MIGCESQKTRTLRQGLRSLSGITRTGIGKYILSLALLPASLGVLTGCDGLGETPFSLQVQNVNEKGPQQPAAITLSESPVFSREALIKDIPSSFYVTELLGFGVKMVTGDYSRGAGGFWIENGEIAYPVSELTIAGNLKDMFANLTAADDLEFRYGTNAPTIRIDGMTVAGM